MLRYQKLVKIFAASPSQRAQANAVRRRCKNLRIPATPKANTIIWKLLGSGTTSAVTDKLSTAKCALPPLGSLPVVIQRKSIGSPSARGVAREIDTERNVMMGGPPPGERTVTGSVPRIYYRSSLSTRSRVLLTSLISPSSQNSKYAEPTRMALT